MDSPAPRSRDSGEPHGPRQLLAFTAICAAWGSTFLVIRLGTETVPPLWGATLRLLVASAILAVVGAIRGSAYPAGAALRATLLFGFLNLGLNIALLYWGESTVSSGTAALFFASLPLLIGLLAWLLRVHPLDPVKTAAAVVGLGGVALIFVGELSFGAPAGALLGIWISVVLAAISTVVLKKTHRGSPITTNALACLVGAVVCFGGSLLLGESHAWPRTFAAWGPILYLAVAGNLVAFVLYIWLLSQWSATSMASTSLITPVLAVILGGWVGGERFGAETYAGGALVLLAVGATLAAARRERPAT